MMRTTFDIDEPVLDELRKVAKSEKKSMTRLVTELLSRALRERRERKKESISFQWNRASMHARVDLRDKSAVWALLDQEDP